MRLIITLFSIILILNGLKAQNITEDWFFHHCESKETTRYSFEQEDYPFTESGVNIIWDFSDVIVDNSGWDFHNSLFVSNNFEMTDPVNLRFYDRFEGTNISATINDDGIAKFYKILNDTVYLMGIRYQVILQELQGNPWIDSDHVKYEKGALVAVKNIQYNDTIHNQYRKSLWGAFGAGSGSLDINEVFTFSGIGTVITPDSTYENCIQIKRQEFRFNGDLETEEYHFYQGSLINEIDEVEIQYDYFGYPNLADTNPDIFLLKKSERCTSTSNENISLDMDVSVVNNQLIINSTDTYNLRIQVFDVNGRLHSNQQNNVQIGKNYFDLNTKKNAINLIFIQDLDSGKFYTHKVATFLGN